MTPSPSDTAALVERLKEAERVSEGRRLVLIEKADEARREWLRAENAEGQRDRALSALAETTRQITGYQSECREVEQILGKALGYPWFKDDQDNFPGASEADGVCVGEHTPSTIAAEAASALAETQARLAASDKVIDRARQLCVAWPPQEQFNAAVVALQVELSMLVYGYDVTAPPAAAAERGETT